MKRHLFTIFSAISLLLCLASAALLVRSYWFQDVWAWDRPKPHDKSVVEQYAAFSGRGILYTRYIPAWDSAPGRYSPWQLHTRPASVKQPQLMPGQTLWRRWGFCDEYMGPGRAAQMGRGYTSEMGWEFSLPYWFVAVVFSVLPGLWLWARHRRRRRGTPGLCSACGYDLRATTDRCPECGTPVPKHHVTQVAL